jgi:hypothetical protein
VRKKGVASDDSKLYCYLAQADILVLIWLLLFGAEINKFIYNFKNYLFGCHRIG